MPVATLIERVRSRPAVLLVRAWFRASPPLAIAVIVVAAVTSLLPALFALSIGALVAALPHVVRDGVGSPAGQRLVASAFVVGVVFALQQVAGTWRAVVLAGGLGRRVTTELADRQTATMLAPPTVAHLEDPSFLDDVAKAKGYGGIGPWAATTGLVQLWTSRAAGFASLAVAARYHPLVALLVLVALVVNVTILRRQYVQLVEVMNRRAATVRRSDYLRDLARDPILAKEIRLFGFDRWLLSSFDEAWLTAMRDIWRQRTGMALATIGAITPLVAAVAVALMATRSSITAGSMGAGATAAFVQGLLGSMSLASVARSDSWIAYGTATLPAQDHLERRVRADRLLVLPGTEAPGDRPFSEIRFEGVGFTYPGSRHRVFECFDLVIPVGKSLGIVGVNGAGKTTLVNLLTRLYDPDGGRLLVDGIDAREFDPVAWQRRFAVLFQDFGRYPLTFAENVKLGAPNLDESAVAEAVSRSGASGLVSELPDGWSTVLWRQLGGVDLSGGEWQRVGLARTFTAAAAGAGVLVLDEPTSQLDARAEAAFYDEFLDNTRGLTTLVISHRLAAVRRADRIAVIADGKIAEEGSHDELMQRETTYRRLFRLQASRFTALEEDPRG